MHKNITRLSLAILAALCIAGTSVASDQVKYLPGYGVPKEAQYSGYLNIPDTAQQMYYYLVSAKKHPEQAPLIIWLNGGPGSSSFYGFFTENGPYRIDTNLKLKDNPFSWNNKFNYLILDQPIGVGYSYPYKNYIIKNEAQTTKALYLAIQAFYKEYPEFSNHKLFIAGESYAGKYIPEVALLIQQKNAAHQSNIPLTGIILGDAWVNPLLQQSQDANYAYSHGLIGLTEKKQVEGLYKNCARAINESAVTSKYANRVCGKIGDFIRAKSHLDLHNIGIIKDYTSAEYARVEKYLNLPEVKNSLHVTSDARFNLFSNHVASALEVGEQSSSSTTVLQLLNHGLKVLVFNGLNDATDSNFMGAELWLTAINFGKFNQEHAQIENNSSGIVMGYSKSYKNLTFIKLLNAGHMAPEDQPQNTLNMLESFIEHET